jgi:transcriptional regulator with XRE-family HTH domain
MKAQEMTTDLTRAKTADEFLSEFRSDPENDRLFRESEISFDVCERMKAMRKASGLRQEDLAELVGCSQSFIAKLEHGAYNRCGIGSLLTYARAMGHGIDVDAMFQPLALPNTGRSAVSAFQHPTTLQSLLHAQLSSFAVKDAWGMSSGIEIEASKVGVRRPLRAEELDEAA